MSNHLRSIALLAAGIILGAAFTALDAFPTAKAQTKSESKSKEPKTTDTKTLPATPQNNRGPIFPATDDPEIARLYATAYIVGEALRAGVVETEKAGKLNPVDATKNLVADVYKELGGK